MTALIDDNAARAMDRVYKRQRYIYNLTRKYYLLGRDRLIRELQPGSGDRVLEVGCGTGRNLVSAARRFPQARFFGFDISREMLDSAGAALVRSDLAQTIRIAQADATSFDAASAFDGRAFDRVYISYTLSMIPDWQAALRAAAKAVAPGGSLHVVDFGQQGRLPRWFHRTLFAWLARFHVHPSPAFREVMEALAREEGFRLVWRDLFRGYAIYAVLKREG
jgi:S-adenosylmethionine-diacylgycerolhomoserine-N-methlytransferase